MLAQEKVIPEHASWIGNSPALENMKQTLLACADNHLPVLLVGATGCGKSLALQTIRENSAKEGKPLLSLSCKLIPAQEITQKLAQSWQQAKGGILFIRDIDTVPYEICEAIKEYWLRNSNQHNQPRLIASVAPRQPNAMEQFHVDQSFTDWLHYHCLNITLKSLYERKEDLAHLFAHFRLTQPDLAQLQLSDCAWETLHTYKWPGNVKQLKRCLEKIQVLAPNQTITRKLLLSHFPAMRQPDSITVPEASALQSADNTSGLVIKPLPNNKHHPALVKALQHIQDNYTTPITMDELASKACVSPSHLSYLFKRDLGQPFKQVLLKLRISKAMGLLSNNPHRQVTHVCDDVGFSDLSFFERKFKTIVGVSPGTYRDHYGHNHSE